MIYRLFGLVALLSALAVPLALTQSRDAIELDCVQACLFDQKDLPPNCDCQAVDIALSSSTPSSGAPFPDGLRSASDLIYDAKAQYDARMASIDDYYFVEQSFVFIPPGMNIPGTGVAQMAGVVPTMPIVRFFMGELGPDGEKRFNEVSPGDLARMQREMQANSDIPSPIPNVDPSEVLGGFAEAFQRMAEVLPSQGPAGGVAGGMAGLLGEKFREVQAGVAGMENSEDGMGGNSVSDGFGLALEQELIDNFNLMGIPTYTARYRPDLGAGTGSSRRWSTTPNTVAGDPNQLGTFGIASCISTSCGANQESLEEIAAYIQYYTDHFLRNSPGRMLGYVIRMDTRDNPREIFWEGKTFRLQYAELWLMSVNGQLAILGGDEELVPARRRIEYAEYDSTLDVVTDKVVIDTYSEGFDPVGPMRAPSSATQTIETGGAGLMRVKKLFSRLKVNAGPPSAEEVAALIADTMPTSVDDPTSSIPTSNASPPTPEAEPSLNPATGQTPLIRPGQGTPVVRDEIPVIERPNN